MRRRFPLALVLALTPACSSSDGGAVADDASVDDSAITEGGGFDATPSDASTDSLASDAPIDSRPSETTPTDSAPDAPIDTGTAPSSGCGKAATSGVTTVSITVGTTARKYVLSIPAGYDSKKAYPLAFGWHGRTGDGAGFRGYSGVETVAAGKGVFVYPDGLTVTPSDPKDTGWDLSSKGRDVALFDAILADLPTKLCIDTKRVFSFGFSYGGYMSNALGCFRGNKHRAIAPVAGGPSTSGCTGAVAAWIEHATDDTNVVIGEGTKSRDFWIKQSGCDAATTTKVSPDPCISYGSCSPAAPITWCQRPTGGHSWPSFGGKAIWDFFTALP